MNYYIKYENEIIKINDLSTEFKNQLFREDFNQDKITKINDDLYIDVSFDTYYNIKKVLAFKEEQNNIISALHFCFEYNNKIYENYKTSNDKLNIPSPMRNLQIFKII